MKIGDFHDGSCPATRVALCAMVGIRDSDSRRLHRWACSTWSEWRRAKGRRWSDGSASGGAEYMDKP